MLRLLGDGRVHEKHHACCSKLLRNGTVWIQQTSVGKRMLPVDFAAATGERRYAHALHFLQNAIAGPIRLQGFRTDERVVLVKGMHHSGCEWRGADAGDVGQ